MNRRLLLTAIAAVPFLGRLIAPSSPIEPIVNRKSASPLVTYVKDIEVEYNFHDPSSSKLSRVILSDGRVITDERFLDNILRFRIGDPWTGRFTEDGVPFHLARCEARDPELLELYKQRGIRDVT